MTEEYAWWYGMGVDAERYLPADSREDAIAKATEEAADYEWEEISIALARPMTLNNDIFSADQVLDLLVEKNDEAWNEDGELLGMETAPEQDRELELALAETLKAWREKHKIGRAYALDIKECEVIHVAAPEAA